MRLDAKGESESVPIERNRAEQRRPSGMRLAGSPLYRNWKRRAVLITVGLVALALVLLWCSTIGAVSVQLGDALSIIWNHTLGKIFPPFSETYTQGHDSIIWDVRVPRVLLAGVVGASLASAGATYQGLFRNPLAEPYLVGVAQGAAVGAVVALVLPLPLFLYSVGAVQWLAFAAAAVTVAAVYGLARVGGRVPTTTLLLAGIAVGSLATAFTSFLTYLNADKLVTVYSWLLGGFNLSSWDKLLQTLPYIIVGLTLVNLYGRRLNVLQLGEEQASNLGLNVEALKLVLVLAATLMTAAAVSVSGIIGFVGLVAPHTVRLLTGNDHRLLLPLSAIFGATFMVLADMLARTLTQSEIPVGIITAFAGAPFFIYLLRRKKRMVF
ncbi:iron ABC transporter permease [Candidatus Chlorohelix sp.]|uniref:FecCD family ABC transporter permease n=1 Tax=Candidatus Chlorohelix sp. TaxID=3139201 RepID=UPI00305EE868